MIALILLQAASVASIESVVLYSDRAQVTRVVNASCQSGEATVTFPDLPATAVMHTLSAAGDTGMSVVGMRRTTRHLTEARDPEAKKLEDQIEKLDLQVAEAQRRLASSQQKVRVLDAHVDSLRTSIAREMASSEASVSSWSALLDQARKERQTQAGVQAELQSQIREYVAQREVLQRRLAELAPASQRTATDVVVVATCTKSGPIRLSYVASGATWQPAYDLYVDEQGSDSLRINAIIRQRTGEAWPDVRLRLSTASPEAGSAAPMLRPMFLRAREREESKVIVQATEERSRIDASAAPPPPPSETGTAVVLDADAAATIASNGHDHWVPVKTYRMTVDVTYLAIPKLSPYVYRTANLKNPAPHALLPGRLNSFLNGGYVGSSPFKGATPGQSLELAVGVDEAIEVSRSPHFRPDEIKGLFKKDKLIKRGYRYTVTNGTERAITVRVRENYPVSKTEKIRVTIDEKRSSRATVDEERGIAEWTIAAKSGREAHADFYYQVKLPDDWQVR